MRKVAEIPTPAHPDRRRDALPWQRPKAVEEDPEAMQRVQAILKSPSYRPADTDTGFLAEDDLRGVRLQIDYLKPELLLRDHEIEQSIVVFGSTRICRARGCVPQGARNCARFWRSTKTTANFGADWRLPSGLWPKAITMRSPANLDVSWRRQMKAHANATLPS